MGQTKQLESLASNSAPALLMEHTNIVVKEDSSAEPRTPIFERTDYAASVPAEEFMVPLLKEEILAQLVSLPSDRQGFRVLDVGCGGQPFRDLIQSKGFSYVGLDVQNPYNKVDFIAAIDGELPTALIETGPFDFILCAEVLEHVADWDKSFQNLAVLLKAGGRVLLTSPFFYFLHEQPHDYWRPTSYAFQYYARRYGLSCVTVKQVGEAWDVLGTLLGANLETAWPSTDRTSDKLLARIVNLTSRLMLFLLKRTRRRVWWGNSDWPFYLSNVVVLERN
jgi:SAM-dependent methyltransferase